MDTVNHFKKVIIQALLKFDYNRVEMLIKSLEDYIKGLIFIKNSEPESLHLHILKLSQSYNSKNKKGKLTSIKLLTRWVKVAAKSSIEWSSLSREWESASKELTSIIFW